ncbi:alpha-D-glucose phosphate-specific phosphoglucomutase [Geothermobacter ehrlichii]|uniref:Alpha-D-glucose phosphate-specific phosphoglucomutase n=1 Tax=Geothermobacter ehrlichii TaxID=213224 RepID=A0A5D3WPH6_9BACT|nr:phosphoglucomutase/phosphomannomutase family protein [Geothermobacter ehrlichii]TYP00107.1 alpha-D-glucose phosphate-specific phosphoglucomutase [Geothermobacter ehrlichii]
MSQIKFGTSGWRGVIAEDFTFERARVVCQAIADYLHDEGVAEGGVVIGYDTRFLGRRFAEEAARVLTGSGIRVFLCDRDTPTPVIAHEILRRRAAGAINFTASHNPGEYNGLKFSTAWGGPALPETTRDIEQRANSMLGEMTYRELTFGQARQQGLLKDIDPGESYRDKLRDLIDFRAIHSAGMRVAVNPLYGTGRGYLDRLLLEAGVAVATVNGQPDPCFGGFPPEPAEENIQDFIQLVRDDEGITLGLATDGDADRFGILDADGSYIQPNYVLALLADYLLSVREEKGALARSVATSHFLDAVAACHGQELLETPVGFKYIGEYIRDDRILIGGEESAGLSIRGHVPDKDGILACLLVAEMVARTGKSLKQLLDALYRKVGTFHTRRINLQLTSGLEAAYADKVAATPDSIAGRRITDVVTVDGTKFLLENGCWVLFRKSGTEPVVRVYAEASTEDELNEILQAAKGFILEN